MGNINETKKEKGKLEMNKTRTSFCNEEYQIAKIRRIKLVREIGEGSQRRVSEWVSSEN